MAEVEPHRELMITAIQRDAEAQRALLAGDTAGARRAFAAASESYRASWDAAPPGSFGRLIGMLKSAVLAGGGGPEAAFVRARLADDAGASPPAAYAQALSALIAGDDSRAGARAAAMRGGNPAFGRTADAISALAERDADAFAAAVEAIVRDFEQRSEHLTGVAVADTALMFDELARRRGVAVAVDSPLFPRPAGDP